MTSHDLHVVVDGRTVAGVCWVPDAPPDLAPLVVFGHGLGHDCRSPYHMPVARILADEFGIAGVALDAPGHGSRRPRADASSEEMLDEYRVRWRADAGASIAEEMSASITEARRLIGRAPGPVAYWGLSLGTQYGLAFLAGESNVRAAVLGLFGAGPVVSRYAARVRCPVLFVLQQQDELHPGESVEALYAQIASEEKRLVSSPGAHAAVPADVVRSAVEFIAEKLST